MKTSLHMDVDTETDIVVYNRALTLVEKVIPYDILSNNSFLFNEAGSTLLYTLIRPVGFQPF